MVWQGSHWLRTHRLFSTYYRVLRSGSLECVWMSHCPLSADTSLDHLLLPTRHPGESNLGGHSPSAGNTHPSNWWLPHSQRIPRLFLSPLKCLHCRPRPVLSSSYVNHLFAVDVVALLFDVLSLTRMEGTVVCLVDTSSQVALPR